MAYAMMTATDAVQTYRRIDLAGRTATADGPALVQLLYGELVGALRAAAFASERGQQAVKSERIARATAILFALDAGLDFERGGDVSKTLSRLYAGARATIIRAAVHNDPAPFRTAANDLEEIAQAWATARAA